MKKVFLDYQQQIEKLTKEKKLYIPDPDYAMVLSDDWFLELKKELIRTIDQYLKKTSCFTESDVLRFMGFPGQWKSITRYKK